MNKIYKVIYCKATQTFVAVSEFAKGKGKRNTRGNRLRTTGILNAQLKILSAAVLLALSGQAYALCDIISNEVNCGLGSSASGTKAIAIGKNTSASGTSAIAIGKNASASGVNSVGIGGRGVRATGGDAVAIGTNSTAEGQAVAMGQADAGYGAIAIGNDDAAAAMKKNYTYKTYAFEKDKVYLYDENEGKYYDTAKRDENGNWINGTPEWVAETNVTQSLKATYDQFSGDTWKLCQGSDGWVQCKRTTAADASTALGVRSQALGGMSAAFGTGATVEETALLGTAIGSGAKVTLTNAVAIGAGSQTDSIATKYTEAKVQKLDKDGNPIPGEFVTYKGFTGGSENLQPGDYVSLGKKGNERQLKNIAAGRVAPDSTDAINGSQLVSMAQGLQKQISDGTQTYFHVNEKDATQGVGDATTNLGGIRDKAGATEDYAVTAGVKAKAEGTKSVALGYLSKAQGASSFAMGENSVAAKANSIAIGADSKANTTYSTAIGRESNATGSGSMALGGGTQGNATIANGSGAVAIGGGYESANPGAKALAKKAVAIGNASQAAVEDSIALGSGSIANIDKGAVGSDPLQAGVNDTSNVWRSTHAAVSVGSGTTITRQITSVAAGTNDTDAVNVAQLKASGFALATSASAGAAVDNTPAGAVDDADKKIKNGETVTIDAGNNIKVTQDGPKITVEAEDTVVESANTDFITVTPTETTGAGVDKFAVDVSQNVKDALEEGKKHTKVIAGDDVTVTPGNDNGADTFTVAIQKDGTVGAGDNRLVTGDTVNTAIQAVKDTPITFKGDSGTETTKLGENFSILSGDVDADFVGANLKTKVENDKVTIGMTKTPTFDKVTVNAAPTADSDLTNKKYVDDEVKKVDDKADANTTAITDLGNNTIKLTGDTGVSTNIQALNKAGGIEFDIKGENGLETVASDDQVVVKIDDATKTKIDNAADKDLSNITPAGKTVITNLVTIENGENTVGSETVDPATGVKTFRVDVATEELTTNADGTVDPSTSDAPVSATSVVNAINNSFWKTTAKDGVGGGVVEGKPAEPRKVKAGDLVTFDAGKNMKLTQGADGYTYATKDDVKFDSVEIKDGPTINADGIDMKGDNKITNLADGTDAKDAVNKSQLDNAVTGLTNAGFDIGADNGTDDKVKLGEKVDFVSADESITTTVSDNEIDFAVNPDKVNLAYSANGGTDKKVSLAKGLNFINGTNTTAEIGDNGDVKFNVVTEELTTNADGTVNPSASDAPVSATSVVNAINNSFWKTTAKDGVGGGVVEGKPAEPRKVKAGDLVTFDAGKNMKLTQGADGYTYATKDDVKFDSVEIKDGPTINADGIDMKGDNKITNLADGTDAKDAVNKSQLDNAVTGLTNAGFDIGADNGTDDKVKLGEKVDFVSADESITTTVSDNEIDFAVNPDKVNLAYSANGGADETVSLAKGLNFIDGTNTTAEIGDNGDVKFNVVTGDIEEDTAAPGKVKAKAGDENKVATAGDVADAINNSFHKVTNTNTDTVVSAGTATAKIKAGDTITFEAGKNLVSKLDENGLLQVSTAKEVAFDKVTTKKVTGLDDGVDDTDAVNMRQLKALTAAATTKVATETPDLVEINSVVDNTDKSTTYNVNIKTSKLENKPNGQVKVPAKPNSLATAGDVANAINNAGWNTEAGTGVDGGVVKGKTTELVKTGEKVIFDAGKNMKLVQDGQKYTYATRDEVEFTKTTVGNIVTDGTTNKITGLEAGDISATSKGAVNGSQLYDLGDSTANALGGTSKFDPKTGKVTAGLNVGGNQYDNVQDALTGLNATASAHNTTTAGKNIEVVETPNADGGVNYEVKTKDEVEFNKVTAKKVTGLDAGTADKDAVNVSQLKDVAGAIGGGSTVNPDGTVKQPEFTLTDGDPNSGSNKVYNSVGDALGGLNTAVNQPLTFKGDEGNTSEQKLGSTFEIVAGNAKDTSVDNLKTKVEDGKVTISMADAPTFKGKVSAKGVDAGGERITNVARGKAPTDAVNVSQLKGVAGSLYKSLDGVSRDSKAGIAGSAAFALLGHARDAGDSAVSAGIAFHEGEAALAVGMSSWSDNGRWLLKGAVSQDTRSQTTVGASATYNW